MPSFLQDQIDGLHLHVRPYIRSKVSPTPKPPHQHVRPGPQNDDLVNGQQMGKVAHHDPGGSTLAGEGTHLPCGRVHVHGNRGPARSGPLNYGRPFELVDLDHPAAAAGAAAEDR